MIFIEMERKRDEDGPWKTDKINFMLSAKERKPDGKRNKKDRKIDEVEIGLMTQKEFNKLKLIDVFPQSSGIVEEEK